MEVGEDGGEISFSVTEKQIIKYSYESYEKIEGGI